MRRMSPRVNGSVRRWLFLYILYCILDMYGLFAATRLFGLDFDPLWTCIVVPGVIPVTLASWQVWRERGHIERWGLDPWWGWLPLSWIMWSVWASSYFFVGVLTDPARVTLLPATLDRFVPFQPEWVFLYLCVYPMLLLPYFRAPRMAILQRLSIGFVVMMSVSYAVFLTMPVAFDRPALPDPPPDLARWVLQIVHGKDPPWNCMPSTHCAVALLAGLALMESGLAVGAFGLLTALAIGVSTLYTKQHYVVDVLAGYLIGGATWWTLSWIWRNPSRVPEPARRVLERALAEEASR